MPNPKKQLIFEEKTHAEVMQDKSAVLVNRPASEQDYRPIQELRLNSKAVRSDFEKPHQEDSQAHPNNPKSVFEKSDSSNSNQR